MTTHLSKSLFNAGTQCPKRLWWEVHDPDAPELVPDPFTQHLFAQGREVGDLARRRFPGGVLIDLPYHAVEERVRATRDALAAGAPAVFEASFESDEIYCAVDVLERMPDGGFVLIEVKSSSGLKPEHLPELALETHVVRRAGIEVRRVELMHLNRDCRFPDLSDLFVREDVTAQVEAVMIGVAQEGRDQRAVLEGPLPAVPIGPHCVDPRDCPFIERCWAGVPQHHVTTLYGMGQRAWELVGKGYETLHDLPPGYKLSKVAQRQLRAVRAGEIVVEPGLRDELAKLQPPVAYLDFETVGPAVPVWPGLGPWHGAPVQFSCHIEAADGSVTHREWLAEGPDDPRPGIAAALVEAVQGARAVTMYTSFERTKIRSLAESVPSLARELTALDGRLVDLEALVRNHVYHPAFAGSFSLKYVLPALVPDLSYEGLEVQDGNTATALLYRLLLKGDRMTAADRSRLRQSLLKYCKLDSLAMVKLVGRLRELARPGGG